MQCPKCHCDQTKVIDSRSVDDSNAIRRRRECVACAYRFNTYERVERTPLLVVKRDGTREEFSRDKLLRGIVRAAEKRPITRGQMEKLASDVENDISKVADAEIPSERIGEFVMPRLMQLDEVSYIRFASVYRQFQSREMFIKELESMMKREAKVQEDHE
ncbi:transcriptional repressor NrdR [Tuanshanicoccus lijuaniae]|uniref:transcriptional regulator NrdR n=1 Tax=Aerococcaceae bacterium zg-1292 TaxID=2774330 RepID=UPI001936B911|nr:transcriptional repressor NrdR [Aerococcaceae bacterium zg-1292]MBF6625181.1 transcriptional repressor NrdR [Aerococcaceae bacterium zg-BR9]MBF6978308.1 transcriptional repressor NrdR [Aerococcaceae bacterium zg-BR22]MBS4456833.1 transcriptional regulator NrdR [Aerococcaceae bacterium zg-A91]MBS4458661.1 transcriptional regulator NrdR [Aerococcaceae bacterium zg-BR33]